MVKHGALRFILQTGYLFFVAMNLTTCLIAIDSEYNKYEKNP